MVGLVETPKHQGRKILRLSGRGFKIARTSANSTITAYGARIAFHDVESKKSTHGEYAPTAMDLSAVAPGLPGPKWRRTKARSAP